ncbi:MAG: phosphoribosylanthranilate isomerase [Bryobacterales bacterium]|nr:phosphoribosylanthranilate isomerase [Bryobacterales bacterium]
MMVKICGITNRDDARAAVESGASALGFNFYAKSKRCVTPDLAAELMAELPSTVLKVGVFVNEAPVELAEQLGLDVLQVHGTPAIWPRQNLWRALSVTSLFRAGDLDNVEADAFLLDAPSGAQYGGTGETFDWALIRGLPRRIIVAGGLDADNVSRAIAVAQPWGVDACSRIESAPGKKDHRKMAAFITAALRAS